MRTESPEEVTNLPARSESTSTSVDAVARTVAKLAGYAIATVAVTFALLRPNRGRSNNRGSLFLGSGVIVVLIKTLLAVSEGTGGAPSSSLPLLAAATPAPAEAPAAPTEVTQPPAPRKRPPKAASDVPSKAPAKVHAAEVKTTSPAAPVSAAVAPVAPPATTRANAPGSRNGPVLGPRYADKAAGYSVQFPAGWTQRPVKDAGCWVLDAANESAAISVGFSKFPAGKSVDEVIPAKITRSLQQRAGTVVHAFGYGTLGGRRCLWHKYTGPISRPEGPLTLTVVHYWMPLQDGRALEVRVAAPPEKFNAVAPRMQQSVDSLKLLARTAVAGPR